MKLPPEKLEFHEQLGARYERALMTFNGWGDTALRDESSGKVLPVQSAPATLFDESGAAKVALTVLDIEPRQKLSLILADDEPKFDTTIRVETADGVHVITNGEMAVKVPVDGLWDPPLPGPLAAFRIVKGEWFGSSSIVDVAGRGRVTTNIESLGPCFVQWRTTYRWGGDAGFSLCARWGAGADTIQICEEIFDDSSAAVEWLPFDARGAQAHVWGGGEGKGPMRPLTRPRAPGAQLGRGRRLLGRLSHIAYFNQWNYAWAGFTSGDENFVGIFTGWGALWTRRGHVRPELHEDDERGTVMRFPLKQGRRFYGIVLSTATVALGDANRRCLPNRRKAQLSDLRLDKVSRWQLSAPLEPQVPHLVKAEDLLAARTRLAQDPSIPAALERFAADGDRRHMGVLTVGLWKNDTGLINKGIERLLEFSTTRLADIADGGYERLIIFDGRIAKTLAYDLDALWTAKLIDTDAYTQVRRALLAVAYGFADPDYWRLEDFDFARNPPEEGIAAAMKDEMGDCPVPPNFAAEFFTTTGVIAELFERHPQHAQWRAWGIAHLDWYLARFFAEDGTYAESLNYHVHCFSELLCHMYPLWLCKIRDYFSRPQVKGSFEHFIQMQMPALTHQLPELKPAGAWNTLFADWNAPSRCPLPADSNSGGDGLELDFHDILGIGAAVYQESEPRLAGMLMNAWRRAGKPILNNEHPLLTLATLRPEIESTAPVAESQWRHTLGVISKGTRSDRKPVWALFRAGRATHHMDFDQGNLHLACGDTVLLGDHGYHTKIDGKGVAACATWLHNTIVYSENRHDSSGYTGLERAPEPVHVHVSREFDWVVHRITNTNVRRLDVLPYTQQLPVATTQHVRHYLFVKPDFFVLWDVFEEAHGPSTFWLHPPQRVEQLSARAFRTVADEGKPRLGIYFVEPGSVEVIENQQAGPLWSLGVKNAPGAPYLTLLVPEYQKQNVASHFEPQRRRLTVTLERQRFLIDLPPPGTAENPIIRREAV